MDPNRIGMNILDTAVRTGHLALNTPTHVGSVGSMALS